MRSSEGGRNFWNPDESWEEGVCRGISSGGDETMIRKWGRDMRCMSVGLSKDLSPDLGC